MSKPNYKKVQFFPGLRTGGGLGRHCECLVEINHDWFHWDYEAEENLNLISKIKFRLIRRFYDGSLSKFNKIDMESAKFLSQTGITPEVVLGFSGCSLRLFENAQKNGAKRLELESPTAHISHCYEMYKAAHIRHPFDNPWLKKDLRDKILCEYSIADVIWVNSEYSRQTFMERGFPGSKLQRRVLSVSPKFNGKKVICKSKSLFNIVYVGSLTVAKGVPTLIEAFKQINGQEYRLQLVGGSSSSGMAQYLRKQLALDQRITVSCGDPVPFLEKADLFVFPSWADGWGFSAMEAVEFGIPIVVTNNSGCKERILAGIDGTLFACGNDKELAKIITTYKNNKFKANI